VIFKPSQHFKTAHGNEDFADAAIAALDTAVLKRNFQGTREITLMAAQSGKNLA
jgi:hypothetical protein